MLGERQKSFRFGAVEGNFPLFIANCVCLKISPVLPPPAIHVLDKLESCLLTSLHLLTLSQIKIQSLMLRGARSEILKSANKQREWKSFSAEKVHSKFDDSPPAPRKNILMQIMRENLSATSSGWDDWFVNKLEKHFVAVLSSCVALFTKYLNSVRLWTEWEGRELSKQRKHKTRIIWQQIAVSRKRRCFKRCSAECAQKESWFEKRRESECNLQV